MSYGRGHCKGTRRITRHATPEFDAIQAAHLARLEAQAQQGYVLAMTRANLPYAAQDRQDVRARLATEYQA
jgi:hypothetical protein